MNRETLEEVKEIIGREIEEIEEPNEVNVTTVEEIEALKEALRTFAVEIKELDDARDLDISVAKQTYNVDYGTEKKDHIVSDYKIKRDAIAKPVYKYLDSVHKYLTDKIDNTERIGEVTNEALNEIEILKQLKEIDKKDLQSIVRKHEESPLVIQLLSEIGAKHKYYFEAKDPKGCIEIPNEIRTRVEDLIENYKHENESYDHEMLLTDSNNWLDQKNALIDSYLFGDIEVKELIA